MKLRKLQWEKRKMSRLLKVRRVRGRGWEGSTFIRKPHLQGLWESLDEVFAHHEVIAYDTGVGKEVLTELNTLSEDTWTQRHPSNHPKLSVSPFTQHCFTMNNASFDFYFFPGPCDSHLSRTLPQYLPRHTRFFIVHRWPVCASSHLSTGEPAISTGLQGCHEKHPVHAMQVDMRLRVCLESTSAFSSLS